MDDYRQSEEYCQYFYKKGWYLETIGITRVLIKSIGWSRSIIKIQRGSAETSLVLVDEIAKSKKALLVVFEPDIKTEDPKYKIVEKRLAKNGYHDLDLFLSPTKTSYIDLTKNESEILASFDQDIRKNIIVNMSKNISFRKVENVKEFYILIAEAGHHLHIFIQKFSNWNAKWRPFEKQVKITLAFADGKLLGGNMFSIKPPLAFGLFLPITASGRAAKVAASLIWEGLKIAKQNGCTHFDLNGLYDSRFHSPAGWLGLSAFKKKFKGHEVEFMQPKVKVYSRLLKPIDRLGLLWIFYADSS